MIKQTEKLKVILITLLYFKKIFFYIKLNILKIRYSLANISLNVYCRLVVHIKLQVILKKHCVNTINFTEK